MPGEFRGLEFEFLRICPPQFFEVEDFSLQGGQFAKVRNGTSREFNWVEPSQRSSLHGTVIKIEPIDMEEGFHGPDFRLRKGEEKLSQKNARAVPEGTAPRPAVETNGRDVVEN